MLVISSVETDDSGTYVCTVTAGSFQVLESKGRSPEKILLLGLKILYVLCIILYIYIYNLKTV